MKQKSCEMTYVIVAEIQSFWPRPTRRVFYPDYIGDGGICDKYNGVPYTVDVTKCCYNQELWCPDGMPYCDRCDRGAYPFGNERVYGGQMADALAISPFPNAILWNWATIFILAFGNLAALGFQA